MAEEDGSKEITIDLGFIGHNAEKIQDLFERHTKEPNSNGYFLRVENYSVLCCNLGVLVYTNIYNEVDFKESLLTKLLFNLDES
jgi:hypothetical protein